MKKFKSPTFLTSTFLLISTAASTAEPLSKEQIECYKNILEETYPHIDVFEHISSESQERVILHNGNFWDKADIIFWNDPRSPDFSIHRYDHNNNNSASIGSGGPSSIAEALRKADNTPADFAEELPKLRDRIRDEDCNQSVSHISIPLM